MNKIAMLVAFAVWASGCATAKPKPKPIPKVPSHLIEIIKYEKKTRELIETTGRLRDTRQKLDDQKYRLAKICTDYPEHLVCQPQTAAAYAKKRFCADGTFTQHVDSVVKACHQGQCKQVAQARHLSRTNYMLLLQKLPHALVLFKVGKSNLDKRDRRQLQQFAEALQAEKGYFIIVGRASKEGRWKKNVRLALDRAEVTRKFLVEDLGISSDRVGYITYGHAKMYLTKLDAERLGKRKLGVRQANRSALIFSYPCYYKKTR